MGSMRWRQSTDLIRSKGKAGVTAGLNFSRLLSELLVPEMRPVA